MRVVRGGAYLITLPGRDENFNAWYRNQLFYIPGTNLHLPEEDGGSENNMPTNVPLVLLDITNWYLTLRCGVYVGMTNRFSQEMICVYLVLLFNVLMINLV